MRTKLPIATFDQIRCILLLAGLLVGASQIASGQDDDTLRAKRVVTTSDDFVVDVYLNGKQLEDSDRRSLGDVFGAVTEEDDIAVNKGDWLVFHVVYAAARGQTRFFSAAGVLGKDHFGFVSDPHSGDWSYCDDPAQVARFISDHDYLSDNRTHEISDDVIWGDGMTRMKKFVGDSWKGLPLWGKTDDHSVWLKVIVR